MTKELAQVLALCPETLRREVEKLPGTVLAQVEELRLRSGYAPRLLCRGKELSLAGPSVDKACLEHVLGSATGQAVYSAQEMLKNGFLTVNGGHRLGLCGRGVYRNGQLYTLTELSSINLRVARQFFGMAQPCADYIWTRPRSSLILGPPGRGKTTLLRDLVRLLSVRFSWRIAVADERLELAACHEGKPQLDLGPHTDILSGVQKEAAIELLLRCMNPQWIALDEITAREDVTAMVRASYCGVRFLATAHAENQEELKARPVYRELLASGIFQNLFTIQANRQVRMERMESDA